VDVSDQIDATFVTGMGGSEINAVMALETMISLVAAETCSWARLFDVSQRKHPGR
jgi:hypothetical protein